MCDARLRAACISRARLFECAQRVLGTDLKEADLQKLLRELETVNSIIKPIGEGSYVARFAHF